MSFVLIPIMVIVVCVLAWSWWSGRVARNPVTSVDNFHRALAAMQPGHDTSAPAEASARRNDG
ncbi:MAG: hypothetical protein KY462_00065 [Actinobacteria bacterium]|nr:hypothetical protein [Actinomycetota bacterium]